MIPTIGRKVWFYRTWVSEMNQCDEQQPFDATVVYVLQNEQLVNLSIIDHVGHIHFVQGVRLLGEDEERPGHLMEWAEWIPYQKAQAKKVTT